MDFRYFHFWFIAHFSCCGSGVTNIYDSLYLRDKTNLKNRVELVNKALLSYQKSKDSIVAGQIDILRRMEAELFAKFVVEKIPAPPRHMAYLSSFGSWVTIIHDSLKLFDKTKLKNRVELVNTALLSYQKSMDSIDAGPICIVRRIEAKEAGVLNKFEDYLISRLIFAPIIYVL
jgi:hypothetical protein